MEEPPSVKPIWKPQGAVLITPPDSNEIEGEQQSITEPLKLAGNTPASTAVSETTTIETPIPPKSNLTQPEIKWTPKSAVPTEQPDFEVMGAAKTIPEIKAYEPTLWEKVKMLVTRQPPLEPESYKSPFNRGAKVGAYYLDKYLTGVGGGLPELKRTVEQRYNEDLDFYPTPKEKAIANTFQFLGGLRTAGKVIGAGLSRIPAREAFKTILGTGLTFGLRKADEEVVTKIREGKPIDWQGIHFEAGIGELFGVGDVGIQKAMRFIAGIRAGTNIVPFEAPAGTREAQRAVIRSEIQTALDEYKKTGDRAAWDKVREKYMGLGQKTSTAGKPSAAAETPIQPLNEAAAPAGVAAIKPEVETLPVTSPKTISKPPIAPEAKPVYMPKSAVLVETPKAKTYEQLVNELPEGRGKDAGFAAFETALKTNPNLTDEEGYKIVYETAQKRVGKIAEIKARVEPATLPKTIVEQPEAKVEIGQRGKQYTGPAYRTETGSERHPEAKTAADVIKFEEEELGNDLGITPAKLKELEKRPATDIVWVTRTKEEAATYGTAREDIGEEPSAEDIENVVDYTNVVKGGEIIDDIGPDGVLVLKPSPPPAAKQAWEMTSKEFVESKGGGVQSKRWANVHYSDVQSAVNHNKPVPRNVLEEYKGEKWADEALGKQAVGKITDRIDKIEGVEKSYWEGEELTVYYNGTLPKDTINVRVQKELADNRLLDSVKKINLYYAEKGTFRDEALAKTEGGKVEQETQQAIATARANAREHLAPTSVKTAYLNEKINYGGETRTRGEVIAEMQKQGTPQKQIDAYMMGAKTLPEIKTRKGLKGPLKELGGMPRPPEGLTKAESEHLGTREQEALRGGQKQGARIGYKTGWRDAIDTAKSEIFKIKTAEVFEEKQIQKAKELVEQFVPRQYRYRFTNRILKTKTPADITRLMNDIEEYVKNLEDKLTTRAAKLGPQFVPPKGPPALRTEPYTEPPTPPVKKRIVNAITSFFKNPVALGRKGGVVLSARLKDASQVAATALHRMAFNKNLATSRDIDSMADWIKGVRKLSDTDAKRWNYDASSELVEDRDAILKKYGLREAYEQWREGAERITTRFEEATGIKIDRKAFYYHLKVADLEGLRTALDAEKSRIEEAIKKATNKRQVADMAHRIKVINTLLRGYRTGGVSLTTPGATLGREIAATPELMEFYAHPADAAIDFVETMNEAIARANFFGKEPPNIINLRTQLTKAVKKLQTLKPDNPEYEKTLNAAIHIEDYLAKKANTKLEESIGGKIDELIRENAISAKDQTEIANVLNAYFNPKGMHPTVSGYLRVLRMEAMGSWASGLTQLQNEPINWYEGGIANYLRVVAKRLVGLGYRIPNLKMFGADSAITPEMTGGPGKKIEDAYFKVNFVKYNDVGNKLRLVNPFYMKLQQQARSNDPALYTYLKEVYAYDLGKIPKVIADLKAGVESDDVLFPLYYKYAEVHVASLLETPEGFATGGSARALYFLNTYNIKQFSYLKRQIFNNLRSANPQLKRKGLQALFILLPGLILVASLKRLTVEKVRGKKIKPFIKKDPQTGQMSTDFSTLTEFGDKDTTTYLDCLVDGTLQLIPGMNRYTAIEMWKGTFKGVNIPWPKLFGRAVQDYKKGKVNQLKREIPVVGEEVYRYTKEEKGSSGLKTGGLKGGGLKSKGLKAKGLK